MSRYTVEIVGMDTETHTNKDDVIVHLVEVLLGMNVPVNVTWPDGFSTSPQVEVKA